MSSSLNSQLLIEFCVICSKFAGMVPGSVVTVLRKDQRKHIKVKWKRIAGIMIVERLYVVKKL